MHVLHEAAGSTCMVGIDTGIKENERPGVPVPVEFLTNKQTLFECSYHFFISHLP